MHFDTYVVYLAAIGPLTAPTILFFSRIIAEIFYEHHRCITIHRIKFIALTDRHHVVGILNFSSCHVTMNRVHQYLRHEKMLNLIKVSFVCLYMFICGGQCTNLCFPCDVLVMFNFLRISVRVTLQ